MRIHRDNSIAVIVDMQEKFFPHVHNRDQLISNLTVLIKGLQVLNVPMIAVEHATEKIGPTISEVSGLFRRFNAIEKLTFSCYNDPDFIDLLDSTGRNNVILVGIEAHVGILLTSLDLLENGYRPIVIDDCISSRRLYDKEIAVERARREGAVISTFESILFELSAVAGTRQFKAVSELIR